MGFRYLQEKLENHIFKNIQIQTICIYKDFDHIVSRKELFDGCQLLMSYEKIKAVKTGVVY